MATGTHTGTNYAIASAPTPATLLENGVWGGKLRVLSEICQVGLSGTSDVDAGSILKVGKLPAGAVPIATFMRYASGSNTTTFAIGSAANTDLLGVFTAAATTPTQMTLPTVATALTADTEIQMLSADDAFASGDIFHVKIVYAVD